MANASYTRKQPHTSCTDCAQTERNYGWLVRAMRAAVSGDGPPSPREVRARRRELEPAYIRPGDDATAQRAWLLTNHPELHRGDGRQPVPISGLILYVFAAVVAWILEHDATLSAQERDQHFDDATIVGEIVQLGRRALEARLPRRRDIGRENVELRVVAQLLGVGEKLVRNRLRSGELVKEVVAARRANQLDWISPRQLWAAAGYRKDTTMLAALRTHSAS